VEETVDPCNTYNGGCDDTATCTAVDGVAECTCPGMLESGTDPLSCESCRGDHTMKVWPGIDYHDHDLRQEHNVATLEDCMNFCISDTACAAIAYEPAGTQICWLKDVISNFAVKSITTSAVKCDYALTNLPAVSPTSFSRQTTHQHGLQIV